MLELCITVGVNVFNLCIFICSSAMHLLQHWQELKDRELTAQQHNKQLLQQFDEAQDTLREMLTLTAAMKTIRVQTQK